MPLTLEEVSGINPGAVRMQRKQVNPGMSLEEVIQGTGEGNGTPLQCSCLDNPMDGEARQAAVHGDEKSRTRLSDFTFTFHFHALEKAMAAHSVFLLENPRDGGAWWAAVYGVAQSRTRLKRLAAAATTQ